MALKGSSTKYGALAVGFHWLSALLIIGALIGGLVLEDLRDPAAKLQMLSMHAPVGLAIGVLTILRALWMLADTRPAELPAPAPQRTAARAVHGLLLVGALVMVGSGMAMMMMTGAGDIVFGGAPGPLPRFDGILPRAVHGIMAKAMIALVVLHVVAALYHQFVMKDGILARMSFRG